MTDTDGFYYFKLAYIAYYKIFHVLIYIMAEFMFKFFKRYALELLHVTW